MTLLGQGLADHARLPALDVAAAEQLAAAMTSELQARRPWLLRLEQLPVGDPVATLLAARLGLQVHRGVPCPVTDVDHDAPLTSVLSVNGRKSLRRGTNRLAAGGQQLVTTWTGGPRAAETLPDLLALRRARDHAVGRASEADDPRARAFQGSVAQALADRSLLEVLRCEVDGDLAAYALVLVDGDVLRVWDGRVRPGVERYGVGWLADVAVLARAWSDPSVRAVDWMRGATENKQRCATRTVDSCHVTGASSPWLRQTSDAAVRLRGGLLRVARRLVPPARRHAVRGLRGRS
ncbi:MAG: GNAT family N-acetyltransferase [Pseudorhodobacter sp.]|nr:GNAT family N-acetyltransferase [Frankiaceae bacterium]